MQYENPEGLGDYAARYTRMRLSALRPAWTLEYIDGLSVQDINDILGYAKGIYRAKK